MKRILILALLAVITLNAVSQKQVDLNENSISKFALSINPLGFVQFGPSIVAELGLNENLALNAHVRFPSLGVLSYIVRADGEEINSLSGIAFGAGMNYFFGEKKNKPERHQRKNTNGIKIHPFGRRTIYHRSARRDP